jgi:hypothetical protein
MFPNSNILLCLKIKYPKNPPVKNAIVWWYLKKPICFPECPQFLRVDPVFPYYPHVFLATKSPRF